jgi:NAD(P)-dependent dehydrogenase (short-subunit alcohol dehydrogenase family)
MQNLAGKTIFITGSSRGIGAETALAFAKERCNVVITFLDELSQAKGVAKKCESLGAKSVEMLHLDVTDASSIKSAIKTVILKLGSIDVLINNAGTIRWKKFESQSDDDITEQINTNLTGLIMMTKYALPHIRETIINLASGAASHPVVDLSVYCATKHGVRGFTEVLALEQKGINVYSVSPTMTSTEMTDYHGMPASKVAEVILQTVIDGYENESGADIKVWEVLNKKPAFMENN